MRALVRILTATALGGIVFLLPLLIVVVLLGHAVRLMQPIVTPVANLFPAQTFETTAIAAMISILGLFLICLLAGVLARTRIARYISGSIDSRIENRVPLYRIIRSTIKGFAAVERDSSVIPVLARFDDAWQIGFILEENADGLSTVFIPQAPTPMIGTVYYMEEARLKRLSITVGQAFRCVAQMGLGSRELLREQF